MSHTTQNSWTLFINYIEGTISHLKGDIVIYIWFCDIWAYHPINTIDMKIKMTS